MKLKILKITILIIAIIICATITVYLFPVMKGLATSEGQVAFKQRVDNSGVYGILALIGLQIAQIFLFILPGEPIEILAGMCYGTFWGTIFIMGSSAFISTIIFLLVKKFGKGFIYLFCNKEKVEKIENSKLFKNPKKVELIVFILFVIPGTPKDLLTYVSGLLPIKTSKFALISTIARFPSIITSTLAGAHIATGNWKLGILLYILIILIVVIMIMIFNKFDKSKTTKSVIDSIK